MQRRKQYREMMMIPLIVGVDMDSDGDDKDGNEAEVDNCVDENRSPTGLHVPELNHLALTWYLKQQSGAQQNEQQCRYYYWTPICH
ncbi:hypothetical protein V6N12_012481 [Hibiscus sabdariffa]|uniref:Uncharacterized protein n=1 Tax=Hibiscus sabdariffa TaxID=183260 RepID=A0ABR2A719_9ROSI